MGPEYLAFDLGGSGGRLVLGSLVGEVLALREVHRFDNEAVPAGDCLYWDLFRIWSELKTGVRKAFSLAGGDLVSMGLDSFSNDHAFIDARGELLTPLRAYRDLRTVRHAEAIYAKMSPERLYEVTGNQIAPFNTLMQLAAMREAGQGHILEKAHRLLFTPDLLVHFMTGVSVSEHTIASVSQMYDPRAGLWSGEILGAFGIPRSLLCDIVPPGTRVGRTRAAWNRELGIPGIDIVSACEHDTASAFVGASLPGDRAIISSGTWSLVGTEVPAPLIVEGGFRHNIANEGGPPGHQRLLRNVMGLWIAQELLHGEGQGGEADWAALESAVAAAPSRGWLIDPDDPAFFAPEDMGATFARLCRNPRGGGGEAPSDLVGRLRCVFESLALKYRWALEKVEAVAGKSLPVIQVIGGGSRNALLCKLTANACGRPVLAGPADATALGNILVQLLAGGRIASIEEGRRLIRASFPCVEYLPEEGAAWEEGYGSFRDCFGLD